LDFSSFKSNSEKTRGPTVNASTTSRPILGESKRLYDSSISSSQPSSAVIYKSILTKKSRARSKKKGAILATGTSRN
jgi:hypothetical protein